MPLQEDQGETKVGCVPLQSYHALWTGLGAQLARDVPFSAICWATMEPIRRQLSVSVGDEKNVATVLGANFSSAFLAGSIAAAATCPLDVARTRKQIEEDPIKASRMTKQMLMAVWRLSILELKQRKCIPSLRNEVKYLTHWKQRGCFLARTGIENEPY